MWIWLISWHYMCVFMTFHECNWLFMTFYIHFHLLFSSFPTNSLPLQAPSSTLRPNFNPSSPTKPSAPKSSPPSAKSATRSPSFPFSTKSLTKHPYSTWPWLGPYWVYSRCWLRGGGSSRCWWWRILRGCIVSWLRRRRIRSWCEIGREGRGRGREGSMGSMGSMCMGSMSSMSSVCSMSMW